MENTRRAFLGSAGYSGLAVALANNAGAEDRGARRFHYVQIDVFTSEKLQGNPLCVFTDARGLSDREMQDFARETNLSETTFVFPRDVAVETNDGVKVRIFTPSEELPFAGHPTLGTAAVLRKHDSPSTVVLDLKAGKVPVVFRKEARGIFGEMTQQAMAAARRCRMWERFS